MSEGIKVFLVPGEESAYGMRNTNVTYLLIIPSTPPFWAILMGFWERIESFSQGKIGSAFSAGEEVDEEALGGRGEETRGSETARAQGGGRGGYMEDSRGR